VTAGELVSIHAPVKGATLITLILLLLYAAGFNPRAREGRDIASWRHADLHAVSIHAPVKGATRGLKPHARPERFNPRAREGRDPPARTLHPQPRCFNPRAREGRDSLGPQKGTKVVVFQSTRP